MRAPNLASDPAMEMARSRGVGSDMLDLDNICYRNASTNVIETINNRGYILAAMQQPGEIVREAREKRTWSQKELADRVGISQPAIRKIESGETTQSKFLPKIAQVLEIDLAHLDSSLRSQVFPGDIPPPPPALPAVGDPYGPKDFRIYSAAEGGLGEIIRSVEPVDWWPRPIEVQRVTGAYGMYIVGNSMIPDFEPGQVAVVNPNLPHIGGKPYIFYAETEDGSVRATVKRLRRKTDEFWHVTQHNPAEGQKKDFTLSCKIWRIAHRIVGRQDPS
jgi:phage repressor protein C with HTH and peptisase S24 domain